MSAILSPHQLPVITSSNHVSFTPNDLDEIFSKNIGMPIEDLPKTELLYIEDEEDYHHLLKKILYPFFNIHYAKNGKEALSMIKKMNKPVDHILLDIALPDIRGSHLYYKLREKKAGKDASIIAVTGHMNTLEANELLKAGLYTILHKPFRINDLFIKIASGRRVTLFPETYSTVDFEEWSLRERYNYFRESFGYNSPGDFQPKMADIFAVFPEFFDIIKKNIKEKKKNQSTT